MKIVGFLAAICLLGLGNLFGQELPKVSLDTKFGAIVVAVDTVNAPLTASNFLQHVDAGSYMDAVFYRVVRMDNQPDNDVKIEVIQGGRFVEPQDGSIKPIAHETTQTTGILHKDGTLSMARLEPGTASTEFFICIGDQPELDFGGKRNPDGQGFAAFGQVVSGMEVVRQIQQQNDIKQTLSEQVKIRSVKRIN